MVVYGDIYIDGSCLVSNKYLITDFTGYQYCVNCTVIQYNQTYLSGLFPVILFNGKKEGDQIKLNEELIVTCSQIKSAYKSFGAFEQALYLLSYKIEIVLYQNTIYYSLLAYHAHVEQAKSLNLPIKLKCKSYEPILLIDYIHLNCGDINNVLKKLYYELFIDNPPILSVIND